MVQLSKKKRNAGSSRKIRETNNSVPFKMEKGASVFKQLYSLYCDAENYPSVTKKRKGSNGFYFYLAFALAFGLAFALAFGFAFVAALTGFIGASQHISSTVSQPHGSSTTTISPHSSHLYFSPFLAKN